MIRRRGTPWRSAVTVTVTVVVVVLLAGCTGAPGTPDGPADATGGPTDPPTATPADSTPSASTTAGSLEVHFINVGQGSATLIVGPTGETMLVDTGDFRDDGEVVISYVQQQGVTRIDTLVTTHADADHIGGHAAVIEYYETEAGGVGAVYDPGIASGSGTYEAYLDAVEAHDVPLYRTQAGDEIPLGDGDGTDGVTVDVLSPPADYLAGGDRNENSVVLRLRVGQTSILLTGDGEAAAEEYLVDTYGEDLRATVMTAGHHGSRTSTSEALLEAVEPRTVLISSAYDSQFGHPHEEVLSRLADRSVPTYWTGTHGTVVVTTDGREVTVATQRAAPTAPTSLRDAPAVEPEAAAGDPVAERATYAGGLTPATEPPGDGLTLVRVHADAAGDDRENLADEYLVFENTGDEPLDLSGWTVTDAAGARYTVPEGVTLAPGERLTLRTGAGTDTATELYWDAGRPVWNNGGDTVTVKTAGGDVVLEEAY